MKKLIAALALLLLAGCSSGGAEPVISDYPSDSDTSMHAPLEEDTGDEGSPPEDGVAKFGQVYTYSNGLGVAVTKAQRINGGVLLTIKVINGTGDTLDAGMIDVSASYGNEGESADCCMSGGEADDFFSGKILPGKRRTATFSYQIPRSEQNDIQVEISDEDYNTAIFTGSVK